MAMNGGRAGRNRTRNLRFWRPLLYQLSYDPMSSPVNRDIIVDRFVSVSPDEAGDYDTARRIFSTPGAPDRSAGSFR